MIGTCALCKREVDAVPWAYSKAGLFHVECWHIFSGLHNPAAVRRGERPVLAVISNTTKPLDTCPTCRQVIHSSGIST